MHDTEQLPPRDHRYLNEDYRANPQGFNKFCENDSIKVKPQISLFLDLVNKKSEVMWQMKIIMVHDHPQKPRQNVTKLKISLLKVHSVKECEASVGRKKELS